MEKIEKFFKQINSILFFAILGIESLIVDKLRDSKIENQWIILLVSIIVMISIFKLLENGVESLIESSEWIRSIILGEDYIEGTWFDIVTIDEKKYFAIFTNSYKNGQIEQNGEQISCNGAPQNSWNTILAKYQNNTLTLIYHVNYYDEKIVEQSYGISIINFSRPTTKKSPVSFTGTFYDMSKNFTTKSFRGFKVLDKGILSNLGDTEMKLKALEKLMNSEFFKTL